MGALEPIYNLLSVGPGIFIYHLLILLTFEAVAGIALIEYRHTRNPDQLRILRAFLALLLLRIPLLVGGPLGEALLAPLLYALEVASLTLMAWAFLTPLIGGRAGKILLFGNLAMAAVVAIGFFPSWQQMQRAVPFFEYAAFWQQPLWDLWATLIPLAAASFLLIHRRRLGYTLPAYSFLLITGGNGLILFDQVGAGRLINLFAYPLLAVAVYRAALQDLWAYREELETLSGESLRQTQELLSLVEIARTIGESLDLDTILRQAVESIAHALDADQAVIFLIEGKDSLRLAARYAPLSPRVESGPATAIAIGEHPALAHAIRHQRQLLLNQATHHPQLRSLYMMLGSQQVGPVLIQPLVRKRRALGALLVTNERSRRPFTEKEARLCHSITAQVSAAVENARLYRRLNRQARRLRRALETQAEAVGLQEAILESIAEGIIVTDPQGRAVLMNAAAEEILHTPRDRILGRPLHVLLGATTTVQRDAPDLPTEPQALHHNLFEFEGRQIFIHAAPIRTPSAERLGLVAVLRDMTGEIQAEQAKQEFIATISHELRTPLTAILGYAEALYGGLAGSLTQTQSNFIHIIHNNARRMVAMANNLIALAESERGRLILEYRETDIPLIIAEVMRAFAPQLEARQLEWEMKIEENFPLVEADPVRMRQVVANLVSNAIKFTFPGGAITVGVATMPSPEEAGPQFYRLWVQDTGIGIPPEEQGRVWERFYRAESPLKIEAGGLGVGLSIVKSVVEAHEGRVWLDSTPGQGSTFTALLPIRRPPSPLPEESSPYPDLETAVGALLPGD